MPQVQIDPALVEKAVFDACRASDAGEHALHQSIDPLYELPLGPSRDEAFRAAYLDLFHRLGLHAAISDLLGQRPALVDRIARCLVCEALQARDERIELLAPTARDGRGERTLVIHVTAQRLASPRQFCDVFRRDLLHATDLVDERFGFRREDLLGQTPKDNLVRDRYHVLWRTWVHVRLMREGDRDDGESARLRAALLRVFSGWDAAGVDALVTRLLESGAVAHEELIHYATNPEPEHYRQEHHAPQAPCVTVGT